MSITSSGSIEMSPGNYWPVLDVRGAKVAATAEGFGRLLDTSSNLRPVLLGKARLNEVLSVIDAGGEGDVFRVEGAQDLIIKIPHGEDSMAEYPRRVASVARYAGVCVEQTLDRVEIPGVSVLTPTYYAIFRIGDVEGVVMSRVEGNSIHKLTEAGLCDPAAGLTRCADVELAVTQALSSAGLDQSAVISHVDLSDDDVFVSLTSSGVADLDRVTVLDFMNMTAPHQPKLWDNQ